MYKNLFDSLSQRAFRGELTQFKEIPDTAMGDSGTPIS